MNRREFVKNIILASGFILTSNQLLNSQAKDLLDDAFGDGDSSIGDTTTSMKKNSLMPYTPREEYYIGRRIAAWILSNNTSYGDGTSEIELYVNQIGRTLAMASKRPETYGGYRVIIMETSAANAFAVPGGIIFITTGLIKLAETEDELAGVLAHEVAHIEKKDAIKQISRAKRNKYYETMLKNDSKGMDKALDKLVKGIQRNVSDGFSRGIESRTDKRAIQLLIKTGYSPQGLYMMLTKFAVKSNSKIGILDGEIQQGTHGEPRLRARNVKNILKRKSNLPEINDERTDRFETMVDSL